MQDHSQATNAPARSTFREYAIQSVLLVALLVIAFPGFFFRGEVLSPADILFQAKPWSAHAPADWTGPSNRLMSDVVTAFYPYYSLVKRELEAGNWPLWNRYELAGMPLMANAQTAVFYPPRLLHTVFDVPMANSLYILFKFWLCGMTAFVCARGLELNSLTSRFVSIAWMLCGYNQVWAYWSLPDVSAWLPILFLGAERTLQARYRQGGILVAMAAAMMLFAGHPETAFTMAFGVGVYILLRLAAMLSDPRRVLKVIGTLSLAWTVALLITSVQVLPLLEYMANSSTFLERHKDKSEPALAISSLVSVWAPRFYGTGAEQTYWGWGVLNSNIMIMLYTGLPVWALVWLGGAPIHQRDGRARYWSLVGASVFCILMAMNLTELRWLNGLPPFSSTVKFYHAVFPVFAVLLLGARGLDRWLASPRALRALAPLLPAAAIPVVLIALLLHFESQVLVLEKMQVYVQYQLIFAAAIGIATAFVLITSCFNRFVGIFPVSLTALLVFDLLFATRGMNPTMEKRYVYPDTELTAYLQSIPQPCRFGIGEGGIASGTFAPYGIEEWLGYDGLYPARVKQFQWDLAEEVWNAAEPLCSIQYYLNDPAFPPVFPLNESPDRFELVRELDGLQVVRNTAALPRARLVGGLVEFDDTKKLFEAMRLDSFDSGRNAYVIRKDLPSHVPGLQSDLPQGEVTITAYSSVKVEMDVRAERDTILILADAYFPGWRATIDGEPVDHFPVYHAFRGVLVPKGNHEVVYEYRPVSFQIGLWMSSLTLMACLVVGVGSIGRTRMRLTPKQPEPSRDGS